MMSFFRNAYSAVYATFSGTQPTSWVGHTVFTLAVPLLLSLLAAPLHALGLPLWSPMLVFAVSSLVVAAWYSAREATHLWGYWRQDRLREADAEGVNKAVDGVGDVLGPLAVAATAWAAYLVHWVS